MELRTIQDWVVRRQLLGVKGVADVSSFGGFLKQYVVALNPDKLKGMNVGIADVFAALEKNNQNTGGAYLDKRPTAYYIRSQGLIGSIQDIENVVVKTNSDGIPVLIRDIATVEFGHAIRYGALTRNDEGEKVGAIVMMLKGENSSEVIGNVKERIEQIRKTLPEGVVLEAFLDRTKLVNSAISTVAKNLAEGALIVIFVLVLLLGNFRAGLIVASVIPLAMLFAVSLMHLFGVSGNLMSLGAIDFGLIIDGAVIIVEATMHHLFLRKNKNQLTQKEMDAEVFASASKIRTSAAFGEIIILIVYLPILALVGIEGKMFKPMAQTVSFAILGAFILSLTYVPMVSALFLSKKISHKRNISDRIIDFFQSIYQPALKRVLVLAKPITLAVVGLFIASILLFNSLGAEFLPQLDEGDFAVETRVLVGSSLEETVDATGKASKILLNQFPDEVKEVVGKIGSGEIPTDPMPIEACDLMVILKDRDNWTKAETREELAGKMSEALEDLPGVSFGFQQPIQMRFNELISGAKQDVVLKIYGEDLDQLSNYAGKVSKIIGKVDGATDLYVEQVTGLPQIVINYNRNQIARYGMNIVDINQAVNAAFAGSSAGMVYEGEKRFDLVVRLEKANRKSLEDVQNLYVPTSTGEQVPLSQVATVQFELGPNQIQRDDAKRRIVVGFNVRGRDVESIVNEVKSKISSELKLESGYYVTYGGSFKNLQEARGRLLIAVPVALLLILVLLYFTFSSMRQSLLIFSAIPLSAIGGILALWMRGMPFSISAGIGFIALFGVAVLNGIVLISEFNSLRKEGLTDLKEIIRQGTTTRLRPVIMTALVASLGFLPMALSTGSGAEVQKPLATVVIGGLFSATLLTLFILPCLYLLFGQTKKMKNLPSGIVAALLVSVLFTSNLSAQTLTVNDCVKLAIENNADLKVANYRVNQEQALKKTAVDLGRTNFQLTKGQYNSVAKNDKNFSISQTFEFPTVMLAQGKLQQQKTELAEISKELTQSELIREVRSAYFELANSIERLQLLRFQDSLYQGFVKLADLRYTTGETSNLEKLVAQNKAFEVQLALQQSIADVENNRLQLQQLMNFHAPFSIQDNLSTITLSSIQPDTSVLNQNPLLRYYQQQVEVANATTSVETNRFLPGITLGYFNQSLIGTQNINGTDQYFGPKDRFTGFTIGLSIPLWFRPQQGRVQASRYDALAANAQFESIQNQTRNGFDQLLLQYKQAKASLTYFQTKGLTEADTQLQNLDKAYRNGEIAYGTYLQGVSQAITMKEQHLRSKNQVNQTTIQLQFLTGGN